MLSCWFKENTGLECPGCGVQRSFLQLTQGNIVESFELYPALLPFILLILFSGLHLIFGFKFGPKVIVSLFGLTAGIAMISFTYKLLC